MKRALAFVLSLILLLGVCGCKKNPDEVSSGTQIIYEYEYEYEYENEDTQGNTVTTQNNSSKNDSEASSEEDNDISSESSPNKNESYSPNKGGNIKDKNSISSANNYVGKFEMGTADADQSQEFWSNISAYAIVYGKDDNLEAVQMLSDCFRNLGIRLSVYKDSDYSLSDKEILVGDTNRFSTGASDASYKVRIMGEKLRFEGNNVTAVEMAVEKFIENCVQNKPLPHIEGELSGYQQPRNVNNKMYNYVWGDEFEDSSVDFTESDTWNITHMMGYYSDFEVAPKNEIRRFTYANDGKLVLTAGKFDFTPYIGKKHYLKNQIITKDFKYANGGVLTTSERMVYRRGYAELRASVPTNNGSWPAWWMRSTGSSLIRYEDGSSYLNPIFTLEVDIFECYSHLGDKVQPNLHKWYKNTYNLSTGDVRGYDGSIVTSKSDMYKYIGADDPDQKQFSTAVSRTRGWQQLNLASMGSTTEEWHTYGFLWTDKKMDFIVDGNTYYSIDLTTPFDGFDDGRYGYNQYMYFLLDNHIYTPAAGKSSKYSSSLPDPKFEIDYIRLYQLDGEKDIIINK